MKKKILVFILVSLLFAGQVFVCLPKAKAASEHVFDVELEDVFIKVKFTDKIEYIVNGDTYEGNIIITGDNTGTGNYVGIIVDADIDGVDIDAEITFRDLRIDNSAYGGCAVVIEGEGSITIELDGENSLTAGDGHAGLEKKNSGTLTIKDISGQRGKLEAIGGSLGAGIGGGKETDTYNGNGEDIIIEGGTITATGVYGAGIGGGNGGDGKNITIKDGTVIANGGSLSAGIGGGNTGNGESITIEGGEVTANGGESGAGIGGGQGGDGKSITIEDGTITAIGGQYGAGIGGGNCTNGVTGRGRSESITIIGGSVIAYGGLNGAGIGGGSYGTGYNIQIAGSTTVTASGGTNGAGIGGGFCGAGSLITIKGSANVIAIGNACGAGIGSGSVAEGTDIHILEKAVVSAAGGITGGASIGNGVNNYNTLGGASSYGEEIPIKDLIDTTFSGDIRYFKPGTTLNQIEEGKAERKDCVTITFDANGGEGTMGPFVVTKDLSMALPENLFTKDAYRFVKWNTKADGSGESYGNMEQVAFSDDTTLYPQWEAAIRTISVSADENGSVSMSADSATREVNKEYRLYERTGSEQMIDYEDTLIVTALKGDTINLSLILTGSFFPNGFIYSADADWKIIETLSEDENRAEYTASIRYNDEAISTYRYRFFISTPLLWRDSAKLTLQINWLDDGKYLDGTTITAAASPKEGYEFVNWTENSIPVSTDKEYSFSVQGNCDLVANFKKKTFEVSFVDEDGTVLQSTEVEFGETPSYTRETPTRAKDVVCGATFDGWFPAIEKVTGTATYKATYKKYNEHDYQPVAGTAVAPTCTKAGKEADQKCSRCGDVITGKEIAATGHTFDQEVVDAKYLKSAADCITAAVYYKSCKCGEKSTDEKDIFTSGEPAGHKWKAATGYAPKTCEVCGLEEGQKVTYDPIKGQVFVWTKGSKEPFVLTIKRSQDDVNCFLHYLNTLLDGAEIKVEARSGSTIITIPAETLEKLAVGEHKITVVFDDWKADFALSIAAAPADTTPVTGDTMPVVPIAVVMVVAFGAAGIAMRRKARVNRM